MNLWKIELKLELLQVLFYILNVNILNMRNKTVKLFNKNHITVEKTILGGKPCGEYKVYVFSTSYRGRNYYKSRYVPKETKVVEKESPLGFVYSYKETTGGHWESEYYGEGIDTTYYKCNIYLGNIIYSLVYPTKYNEQCINAEIRPWELLDGRMSDHFVNDLLEELNKIIEEIKDNGIKEAEYESEYIRNKSISDWKCDLYVSLFGHKDGPRYQTNDEKILSHGFDLVTSFRKQKSN